MIKKIYKLLVAIGRHTNLRKYRFIDNLNTRLRVKLKPDYIFTKRYNHKMYLDKLDSLHLSVNRDWEPFCTGLLQKLVKEGEVVFDIGANIGFYTLIFSKLVGEKGKVYAFEPDPINFSILKKNIEANNIHNVILVNKAVSDKNEEVNFYIYESNTSGNSLFAENLNTVPSRSIKVEAIRLDKYFKKDIKVDFIKMDIEGAEPRALKGMARILGKSKNLILLTEFCPFVLNAYNKEINANARTYLESLQNAGFRFFDVQERVNKLRSRKIEDLIEDYKTGFVFTNLLCIKNHQNNFWTIP